MKKILTRILTYIIVFILTLITLSSALVLSSLIPKSAIKENLEESAKYYSNKDGIHREIKGQVASFIHYYADTRKLDIIYCIDSEKPIESTLWCNYYQRINADVNIDFINLVKNDKEANSEYLRYWNGSMLFLRPLLIFFNIEQIYQINQIFLGILSLVLLILLFIRNKKIAIVFLFSLILFTCWYVGFCIEYSVTFYIFIITSIIALIIDNKKNKDISKSNERLLILFLITGMFTSFIDFLTTEILTIFIPLIFILVIRKKENRLENLKKTFLFVVKAIILWLVGYVGMWSAKWLLSSIILNINALDYVQKNFFLRINGLQGLRDKGQLYENVIPRNFFSIPLFNLIKENINRIDLKIGLIMLLIFILTFINWKDLKNKKYLIILLLFCFAPYVRYLVLANHSYRHIMFTFRDQMITSICLLYIIIDCLNYKLMIKNYSIKDITNKIKKFNKKED